MKKKLAILLVFVNVFYIFSQQPAYVYINRWIKEPPKSPDQYPLVYVDFWATWCAPCISSMPHIEQLEKKFGDRVLFLYLSQEPEGKVKDFMQRRNKNFVSAVNPDGPTFDNFRVRYIPQSFILGPRGDIIWHGQPLELNEQTLNRLLDQSRGKRTKPGRIKILADAVTRENWHTFRDGELQLKYAFMPEAVNEYVKENGTFYLSGSLPYIVAVIKNVPLPLVGTDLKSLPAYRFSAKNTDEESFKAAVEKFLNKKTRYKIKEVPYEGPVYVLQDGENQNLFSAQMYDFERGDNTPLIDEFAVMADNSTKQQFADWLTVATGKIFVYDGDDEQVYDWNVTFTDFNDLLRALREDLGFKVEKTRRQLPAYKIEK